MANSASDAGGSERELRRQLVETGAVDCIVAQVTRANRTFDPDHIEFLGNIVRLWRGEKIESTAGSGKRMAEAFPDRKYQDVLGLCKIATRDEIEKQSWSLNPGRYVGLLPGQTHDDGEFKVKLEALQEELETLNIEAAHLQSRIAQNVSELLAQ